MHLDPSNVVVEGHPFRTVDVYMEYPRGYGIKSGSTANVVLARSMHDKCSFRHGAIRVPDGSPLCCISCPKEKWMHRAARLVPGQQERSGTSNHAIGVPYSSAIKVFRSCTNLQQLQRQQLPKERVTICARAIAEPDRLTSGAHKYVLRSQISGPEEWPSS